VRSFLKSRIFYVIALCALVVIWQVARRMDRSRNEITFTELVRQVEAGKIRKVAISDRTHVKIEYKDNGSEARTLIPANYVEIYSILQGHGVDIEIRETSGGWVSVLINASPFLLLLAVWVFVMRQMQSGRKNGPPTIT